MGLVTGSYQVTFVRLACRWWSQLGPTGQIQGTKHEAGGMEGQALTTTTTATSSQWYGALGRQPVQVILSRPVGAPDGYELALVTTDLAATPQVIIERYADRWSAETMFLDARHLAGVGQARTRTPRSVERLVPFGLSCLSLAIVWDARHGQPAHDLA